MAAVTVFVDEAVQGDLPAVCVRTGQPSDMVLRMEQSRGGLGAAALLLLFLGPPGWLVLIVLAVLAGRREYLVVRVPYTESTYRDERRYGRVKLAALAAGIGSIVLAYGFQGASQGFVWLAVAAACFGASLFCHLRVGLRQVRVHLDASRR
ncbi:MAG: hypothetical protein ACRD12_19980 [Acidimicrobiales bacterium]